MNQDEILNSILEQLQNITTRLETLEIRNNPERQERANNLFSRAARAINRNNGNTEIKTGDRIKITNRYKGQFGKQGTVSRVTEKRIFFFLDGSTEETFRIKKNVRRIPSDSDTAK